MGVLDGRVAIVTGTTAASIGRACAIAISDAGAKVIVTGRTVAGGQETERQIIERGGDALYVRHDVREEGDWQSVVNTCIAKYGRLDILLNNAGESKGGPIETLTIDDLHFLLGVNVDAPFLGAKTCWPHLVKSGQGVILNISSLTAQQPGPGGTLYGPSKAAQNALTRAMAMEGADAGIRAISILPGLTFTDGVLDALGTDTERYKEPLAQKIWMGEWGKSEHIADACVFLASDAARYITGIEFNVDGGGIGQTPDHSKSGNKFGLSS
ncbi:MAG: SDR family oxidoreductase [Rhodospirillaceae bacterium]|jgi:NAD(P)-dependent dehydrogenase (short-subunit alcohol dehydrogenase family)|nr:SDR family oxidoreductase [Rhodospirillaceae bacterium]MBT5566215.1 SDR family oxidoreductase [Rhodospirillaceae bacterium]MBT6088933.1 SDR family oxidoreductase [Rhodospirillaceae bacterium]